MPTDEQLRERENRLLLSLVARKRTLMTDEQLREQFEEVRGKGYPDYVNEHLFQRDEFDNYVLSDINSQWHGWRMAYRSRDAEVQALREALRKIAWLDTGENSSHSDALDALTKIEIIAFAALRGEGGDEQ